MYADCDSDFDPSVVAFVVTLHSRYTTMVNVDLFDND